jgi:hypothetical protein
VEIRKRKGQRKKSLMETWIKGKGRKYILLSGRDIDGHTMPRNNVQRA